LDQLGLKVLQELLALKVMQVNELWWWQTGGKGKALVDGTAVDVVENATSLSSKS
jgi:hypothetical protein